MVVRFSLRFPLLLGVAIALAFAILVVALLVLTVHGAAHPVLLAAGRPEALFPGH